MPTESSTQPATKPRRNKIEFERLASLLLRDITILLPSWLPGGKIQGDQYRCSNLQGGSGQSFCVYLDKGNWLDYADRNQKGSDLTSLYAAINGLTQGEAAKRLSNDTDFDQPIPTPKPRKQPPNVTIPPPGTPPPDMGSPTDSWIYHTADGATHFYVARYDRDGKKQFVPYSYLGSAWTKRLPAAPRPLYNLHKLTSHPDIPVVIAEGEKSADAAQKLLNNKYVGTTWPSGASSWRHANWSPIYGRTVLIWPDSDQPGIDAAKDIAEHLHANGCTIKYLDVIANGGWDAADALYEGYDFEKTVSWAKQRARVYEPPKPPPPVEVIERPPLAPLPDTPPPQQITNNLYMDADSIPSQVSPNINQLWADAKLAATQNGQAVPNMDNTVRLLKHIKRFKSLCWFDDFHKDIFTQYGDTPTRSWSESDTLDILSYMQADCDLHRMTESTVQQAVRHFANLNRRDSAIEWANSLTWDGTHRLDQFATEYLGSPDNEYTQCVSRNLFLSIAARILIPGCQVDNMVVIEGIQGAKKSSLLRVLGGEYYADASSGFGTKDFYQQIQGKLIVEISELDMFRKSDVNTIKRVLTNPVDEYRPPYAAKTEKFPRRCVFVGTTNQTEYLIDDTGNRRFWPLRIRTINLSAIAEIREQLFAEAVARFKAGETWYEIPQALAEAEQLERMEAGPFDDVIAEWVEKKENMISPLGSDNRFTTTDVMIECLGLSPGDLNIRDRRLVTKSLKILGWEEFATRRHNIQCRCWRKI